VRKKYATRNVAHAKSMTIAFTASTLYTPLEEISQPIVFVEDGRITEVSSRAQKEIPKNVPLTDFGDAILAPGYVDIHLHGGAGLDVMLASPSELPRLGKFLIRHGVTGYFPTTVAAPMAATCAALERMADAIEAARASAKNSSGEVSAIPLGIHLEGPFLSHKRRGVHLPDNLVEPTVEVFDRLWQAARGEVHVLTIAPEIPGALEVIAEASRRNVLVSIGHSDAELPDAKAAFKAGARHATHTFNAMRPLDHRVPGILGEVLTNGQISADIIVDGIHVAPEVVQIFLDSKGVEQTVLITDATAATGMPDGRYYLGPMEVEVKDGKVTKDGSLAGSVLTMDRAVRNVTKFSDWSLRNAIRAATLNAAQAVGFAQHGRLEAGAEANFAVMNAQGEVRKAIVRGQSN
jgi:N-acetylglucosamine-6-phosphate deacetylase